MPYLLIRDSDQKHGGLNQAGPIVHAESQGKQVAPIVHEHCRPNQPPPTMHRCQVRVLPHYKSQDVLYHYLQSPQEGVHKRLQRIENPRREPDRQPNIKTVRLRDDRSDKSQNLGRCTQTESDTEPEAESHVILDDDTALWTCGH